ncbi:MAG: transcriptional regulator [Clostridiales bacterium]|nr:transcriptional regulator [Clostridiales bacterium]
MDYASIIRIQRINLGISQEELAHRIGSSLSRIQKWESNETIPNLLQVPLLCAALDLAYEDFFSIREKNHGRKHRRSQSIPMYQISYLPIMCNHTMHFYRLQNNMTVQELASKCSVPESMVLKWESGRSAPKLDAIPVICHALKIKIWQFFE